MKAPLFILAGDYRQFKYCIMNELLREFEGITIVHKAGRIGIRQGEGELIHIMHLDRPEKLCGYRHMPVLEYGTYYNQNVSLLHEINHMVRGRGGYRVSVEEALKYLYTDWEKET